MKFEPKWEKNHLKSEEHAYENLDICKLKRVKIYFHWFMLLLGFINDVNVWFVSWSSWQVCREEADG